MLVGQVERVARELHTTSLCALHEEGVLGAGELPDQVGGDVAVGCRHGCGVCVCVRWELGVERDGSSVCSIMSLLIVKMSCAFQVFPAFSMDYPSLGRR